MKKSIMFLLVFLITLAGAFATIEVTDVKLGGDSQQRGETATVDVSVKNAGATTLSDFNVSFSGVAAKYNAKAVSVPSTIAPGATAVVKVQALVPLDFDAVDADGKKTGFNIGNVIFDGNNGTAQVKTVALFMEAENNLKFTSASRIKFSDEDEKLRDGKTYDNVNRGDTVTLEVEIENSFSDNDDCQDDGTNCDIENIELNLEPNDSDFDDDSDDMSDISAEDEDATTLSFDVPDDIDEDKYDFDLYILGEDENGALHGELMTFTLDIEVERNEIT
ncbi:MAG: hypothetical protein NDI94_06860, partial [Candidatus Woesearchaeota archaeon]|nr:hypothetical protein [Candidatus Woesearchaeota archaeon]